MKTVATAHIAWIVSALIFFAAPAQAETSAGHDPIITRADAVSLKAETTIVRFGNIVFRLESRISKMKVSGTDVAAAEQRLAETKVILAKAERSFARLSRPAPASPAGNPPGAAAILRLELRDLYTELQSVHQGLAGVISLLKNVTVPASVAAQ